MLLIREITQADYPVVEELLNSNVLGGGSYTPEGQEVVVAELHGSVVGIAEFQLDCDFGRDEGRPGHSGEQAWILTMAVAVTHRRHGVGRTLITEIARRAQDAGRTFLALVPQDGDQETDRRAFFWACGLVPIEPDGPGAAWGSPVAQFLASEGAATTQGS
ncbi:GNAT family N-acetyltransferase [Streptomyces goshikiensis]